MAEPNPEELLASIRNNKQTTEPDPNALLASVRGGGNSTNTGSKDDGSYAPSIPTGYEGMEYERGSNPIAEAVSKHMANLSADFAMGYGNLIQGTGKGMEWAGIPGGQTVSENGQGMIDNIADPNNASKPGQYGVASDVLQSLPFAIATMPIGLGGAALGGRAAAALGGGKIAQTVGTFAGMGVPTAAFEGGTEAGDAYQQALQEGRSEEEARQIGNEVFAKNLAFLTASNALQIAPFTKAGREALANIVPGKAAALAEKMPAWMKSNKAKVGATLGAEIGSEGLEETSQENFKRGSLGQETQWNPANWDDEMWRNFNAGASMGGMFAAGAHVMGSGRDALDEQRANAPNPADLLNSVRNQTNMPDDIRSIIDGANKNNQSNGGTTLAIADGVEDSDLSHTNVSIVNRAEALNKFAIDNFGQPLTVSGGWRSPENNARSNGAENSRHLSGGALDISTEGLNDEQRQLLFKMAGELGFDTNEDVIYHDRGSGYHMHLQDAQGTPTNTQGRMSKEAFFNAVAGQESGGDYAAENGRTGAFGKYQIMPDNWPSWSQEAGLEEGAPMTPENQEKVARYKLGDYYDKYGPEGALVAWYSGEGNAQRWAEGKSTAMGENGEYSWDAKQGKGDEPSIREYVQQSLGRTGAQPGRAGDGSSIADSIFNSPPMFSTNGGIIDFASDKYNTSSDPGEVNFFADMMDKNDKFINTPENRKAVEDKYGDELKAYLSEQQDKQDQKNLQELAGQSEGPSLEYALMEARAKNRHAASLEEEAARMLRVNPTSEQGKALMERAAAYKKSAAEKTKSFSGEETKRLQQPVQQQTPAAQPAGLFSQVMPDLLQALKKAQAAKFDQAEEGSIDSYIQREEEAQRTQEAQRKAVLAKKAARAEAEQRLAQLTGQQGSIITPSPAEQSAQASTPAPGFLQTAEDKIEQKHRSRVVEALKEGNIRQAVGLAEKFNRQDLAKLILSSQPQQAGGPITIASAAKGQKLYTTVKETGTKSERREYGASLANVVNAIAAKRFDQAALQGMPQEHQLFYDFLKYYQITAQNVLDVLHEERDNEINQHVEVLRNQWNEPGTKAVVARTEHGTPITRNYSGKFQWQQQLEANGKLRKAELEPALRQEAIHQLSEGYVDPKYGEQVPQAAVAEWNAREAAIHGIENYIQRAEPFEESRATGQDLRGSGQNDLRREIAQQAIAYAGTNGTEGSIEERQEVKQKDVQKSTEIVKGEPINESTTPTQRENAANQIQNPEPQQSQTAAAQENVTSPSDMEAALAALPDAQLNKIARLLKVRKAGSKSRNGFVERIVDSHGRSDLLVAYEKVVGEKKAPNKTPVNGPASAVKTSTTEKTQEAKNPRSDNVAQQEEEHNGSDTNAPLDATSKKEDNVIKEAADLYAAASEKFPEIVADRKVKHRVENAIQQTLDFGQLEGDVSQHEEAQTSLFRSGEASGRLPGREATEVQSRTRKVKRAAQQIGLGITRELVNEGAVSLVGRKVSGIQELAEIAQVLRHPGYEKFHRIYTDDAGNIVYHETVSCMLPAETKILAPEDNGKAANMLDRMGVDMENVGATKVYLVHNHPSGNPKPSPEDIKATRAIANDPPLRSKFGADYFAGHIVLDTDKYCVVDRNGSEREGAIDAKHQIRMTDTSMPHIALGDFAYGPQQFFDAAKKLADGSKTTAFFMTTKGHIRGIVQLPDAVAKMKPERISRYLRWLARANYSNFCSIATSDKEAFDAYKTLVFNEQITNLLLTTEKREARTWAPMYKTWFGQTLGKGSKRLLEGSAEYEDEITKTPAFKRWFGDSKAVDEQGKPLVVYHGTGTEITAFDPSLTGKGRDQLGSGFYFTTQKEEADDYSSRRIDAKTEKLGGEDNPNVLNVYLAIKKPLVVNGSSLADVDFELSARQAAAIIGRAPKIMDKEESPLGDYIDTYWTTGPNKSMITKVAKEYEGVPLYNIENDFFRDDAGAFRQAVYEVLGYDGVVKDFGDGRKHYVAWFPEQIKSVDNQGAFDPNNDNIYFSAGKQPDFKETISDARKITVIDAAVKKYLGTSHEEALKNPELTKRFDDFAKKWYANLSMKDLASEQYFVLREVVQRGGLRNYVEQNAINARDGQIRQNRQVPGNIAEGRGVAVPADAGRPEHGRAERNKDSITNNRSEPQGDYSLPENTKRSQDAFSEEDIKELLAYRGQKITFVPEEKTSSAERAIASMGKTMGVKVRFFVGDPSLRGFHFGDVTYINRKGNRGPAWTFWHEHMHWLRNNDEDLYQDMLQAVEDASHVTDKQVESYRDTIAFGDKMERSAVVEEMLADELADAVSRRGLLESIAAQDKPLFYRLGEFFQKVIAKLKAAVSGQEEQRDSHLNLAQVKALEQQVRQSFGLAAVDGKRLYTDRSKFPYKEVPAYSSEEQVLDSFEKQLDDWASGNRNRRLPLQIGETPQVLQDVGAKALPLEISPAVVHKIVAPATEKGGKHGLTMDMLKQIPEQLADPVMVLKSATRPDDSMVVVTELFDKSNRPVIASVALGVVHGKRVVNAISSAYGRNGAKSFFEKQRELGNVLYENKEKSLVWAQAAGLQLPGAVPTRNSSSTSNIQQKEEEVNTGNDNIRYSMVGKATDKLAEKVGIKKAPNPNIKIEGKEADANGTLTISDWTIASPSRIAKKVPGFTQFFRYADNAMRKLTKLRYEWNKELIDAFELVSKKSERDQLFEVLWRGDMEGKEWTKQELLEKEGVPESVANAYERIRGMMDVVYEQLNAARRQTQTHSKNITDGALKKLKANKFVEVIKVTPGEEDQQLVTWKEVANWQKDYTVTEDALKLMRENEAIQILSEELAGKDEAGTPLFAVQVRESIPNLNRLTGYIPHFFHDFHVRVKVKDEKTKDGFRYETFDSGRNIKEATQKAESYLKENPGAEIVIQPQTFDFANVGLSKEEQAKFAAVIGDKDFYRLTKQTAKDNEISFKEAKELVQETVKTKNRHRFNGNFFQRKGVEGYEKEMQWVLSHYVNTSSRYVAMETEFKPKAIALFERMYGDFNKDQKGLAHYVKDYINDINGNPSNLETIINEWLNSTALFQKYVIPKMGERGALQLANTASGAVAVIKLGVFNVSSALLNFSQLVNSAGLIGDVSAFYKCLHKGSIGGESALEKRVLQESGVLYDIGFESASGYGNHSLGKWADKSMFFFKKTEAICRRGTVLAAYHKGISKGMSHDAAVEYAREINRKANFEYGVQDAPNVFRRGSIISQLFLQFKKYPIKEFELMAEMLGSETSVKQKAIFWGGYLLLAGLLQIPAIDWFDNIIEAATGISFKTKAKKLMFEFAGRNPEYKPLVNLAVYGLGSVANVDFSSRAGVGDAIPKSLSEMTGPFFNTLWSVSSNAARGQFTNALQSFSPGMANIVMAMQGEKRGSRDRLTTTYDTVYERMLRAMGFKSVKESTDTDIQNIKRKEDEELQKDKQKAIDAYLKNPTTENAQKLQSLRVTPAAVRNERRRKEEDKSERTVDGMSRNDRRRYSDLLDFEDGL